MSFFIRKIKIENGNLNNSKELILEKGLNLFYGPSNQGKSLIYKLIDYVFGGEVYFSDIPEIDGYKSVELILFNGVDSFSLKRSLTEDLPKILFCKGIEEQWLNPKHSPTELNNISYVMSTLSGLRFPILSRKNGSGETSVISFRNVVKLLMVSEDEIANTNEVLFFRDTENTIYLNLLKYLLTDEDDSSIPKIKNKTDQQVETRSYNQIIEVLKDILEDNELALKPIEENIFEELKLEDLGNEFKLHLDEKIRLSLEEEKSEKKKIKSMRTLKKFSELNAYYKESLERLDFNLEGHELFKLLNPLPCEKCGNPTSSYSSSQDEQFEQAIVKEKRKIKIYQLEIQKSMDDLKRELQKQNEELEKNKKRILEIDQSIIENIYPKIEQALKMEKEIQIREGIFDNINYIESKVLELTKEKEKVVSTPSQNYKTEDDFTKINNTGLEDVICETLNAWGLETKTLSVDKNNAKKGRLEIYRNGKPRSAEGQGIRGIIHSAFNIAVLKIMMNQTYSRPYFLFLDSPLKNLEEKNQELQKKEINNITQNMLLDLATNYKNAQIIVVENEQSVIEGLMAIKKEGISSNIVKLQNGLL